MAVTPGDRYAHLQGIAERIKKHHPREKWGEQVAILTPALAEMLETNETDVMVYLISALKRLEEA